MQSISYEGALKLLRRLKELVTVVLVVLLLHYFFPIYITSGTSMTSTICDKDLVLGFRFYGELSQGDIITGTQSANGSNKTVIKRVIGLSGDHVIIKDNKVYVNGAELQEDYLYEEMSTDDLDVIVPFDCVFVMGDNRNVSYDSRQADCVKLSTISSKVLFNISSWQRY